MGQSEIIKVLEKSRLPMSAREISKLIDDRIQEVIMLLNKMIRYKEVNFIELDRKKALKYFNSKRKMRLFYISSLKKKDLNKIKKEIPYI